MTRLIKKYKNRRLYDTEISQYITVEDLLRYVLEGISFRVEESKSNTDITTATLLQIFVEMESGASRFLSAEMLRQLIVVAHHPMHLAFKGMLEQLFTVLEKPVPANTYLKDYTQLTDAWKLNFDQMMKQWQGIFKP